MKPVIGFCDAYGVSECEWDELSGLEKAFMINAFEIDILPGFWGDLEDDDRDRPLGEIAGVLLALVDRGWVEVRRIAPWVSPMGEQGLQPGDLVPRDQLAMALEDEASWDSPKDGDWVGALTLVETDAGRKISRLPPEEQTR
ncbi:hypothetical protein P3T36_001712 [Kitasatospora sp. MAP12-15]|uniref:hypothetical protein n=1 Tax=unclassified Kitasatospora TaxID=2633591 RepID=UPI0024739D81|nr:hypothetical protein [Kitasatospora sp. MAP12-44]MDH6113409.1 hypothetical protein [Kitasatospora sp. MAP12-44]